MSSPEPSLPSPARVRTLGVLLAGGAGRRLGAPVPKALAVCDGHTLLERALRTLAALTDAVVVVAPAEMALPVGAATRVDDPPGEQGPLAALVAGLAARAHDEALVLAVDLPRLEAATLDALRARRGDARAVLAAPHGVPQPLAAWCGPGCAESLAAAFVRGERSVTRALLALEPRIVEGADLDALPGGPDAFANVNTPADLALAERALAARREP
jgi:molybdopterin-guanine dinucleotide biosynthesis protein A